MSSRGRSSGRKQFVSLAAGLLLFGWPASGAFPSGNGTRHETRRAAAGGDEDHPLGPQPIQSKTESDRNWGNVSGRVDALAIHPSNPSVLLLGAATGGIWKS